MGMPSKFQGFQKIKLPRQMALEPWESDMQRLKPNAKCLLLFSIQAWSWKHDWPVSEGPNTGVITLWPFNGHS